MRRLSVALTGETNDRLASHLLRKDGQEDVCFALYRPSTGPRRSTVLLSEIVLPKAGDRHVHGNASFTSSYLLRALDIAEEAKAGLVLAHSHPAGRSWQDMSTDDVHAEQSIAAQAQAVTGLPLVGVTMAGDGSLSGRSWLRCGRGAYSRQDHASVRVITDRLAVTSHPKLVPAPSPDARMATTVSAWGEAAQADLARLHVGVVGLGSVGMPVAEALVRTGVREITLLDFDSVKVHNLDRLAHARPLDVSLRRSKVAVAQRALEALAPFEGLVVHASEASVVERQGFGKILDCDVVFSCVDRPWPRQVLDHAAFAHLIPVVDGGVLVTAPQGHLRHADWRAHISSPARRCLECVGQYNASDVALERAGDLDDPSYIQGLPSDHPLRASENVYAFASATASLEILQWLSMVVAPLGIADVGEANYHFVTGTMDVVWGKICEDYCPHRAVVALGDQTQVPIAAHPVAQAEREARAVHQARRRVRAVIHAEQQCARLRQRLERKIIDWVL